MVTGDWLINAKQSKGGSPNGYADLAFGTVTSASPLKIKISDQIELDTDFLTLGRNVTKHTVKKVTYKDKDNGADTSRTEDIEIDGSLKTGENVVMIRRDGGQSFYVLDRIAEDGDS
ncbi:DUF2577 domain-containing protein [Lacticaseibacillus pabuli]|uniref:DUF2577 domain-containing protein n=1 Tax=Lacticaseibacillus pabuli TaxID=3025672 RepID=A0ABY7WU45_9LACO|nr:DUF2577 domain-containing protein [Lacticaseibacillus sp. KACC 23028]WDF83641.1 DUF2577 domain-containing protein [Lacticaseibacillus sp. KACC 23028]